MVRNILRDNDVFKLYCTRAIFVCAYVMIILFVCYYYVMFIAYILIDKIYDSDNLPLTQMLIQRTTGINTEEEDVEEENESYEDNITGNNKSIRQKKYVGM